MTEAVRFARLASRALIAVTGDDWRSFLQGQITQDVETLAAGEARFAALLSPPGRLLFDLFVVGRAAESQEGGCWLDVAAERRDALIQRLTMYRLRAKVAFAADEAGVSAVFPSADSAWVPAFAGKSGGGWVADPRLPGLGARGYGAEAPAGAVETDEAAYVAYARSLGVPSPADWGEDRTYPIEANFDLLNGIDFKKGCFVGQETTSRMKRRGTIKNRMLPISFDGPAPAPGAEVLVGDLRAGEVLSGGGGQAMALLRLDRIEGAALTVDGRVVTAETPGWMGFR